MRRGALFYFAPALVLGLGAALTLGLDRQRSLPLATPLDSVVPSRIAGYDGGDITLSELEQQVAGMDAYLMRGYASPTDSLGFSVFIGYYERQTRGRTIHTPKNCLPGGGWEALASREALIPTAIGTVPVNRYLLQKGEQQVLVLYWYQGRGRVAANEYRVKWNLLRDAALRQRSEEALVRIVVPVADGVDAAFATASESARVLIPALERALPD